MWSLEDGEFLKNLCNCIDRTYLSNRLPDPYTREDAMWWLKRVCEQEGKSGIFRAIEVNGKIVGNISVEQKEDVYCRDAEVGYFLHNDLWGKGIMTQAVGEICVLAFATLEIVRVTGLVYSENTASRRVLEKNGFLLEGIKREGVYKKGNTYDLCIYGKLR